MKHRFFFSACLTCVVLVSMPSITFAADWYSCCDDAFWSGGDSGSCEECCDQELQDCYSLCEQMAPYVNGCEAECENASSVCIYDICEGCPYIEDPNWAFLLPEMTFDIAGKSLCKAGRATLDHTSDDEASSSS